MIDIWIDIQSEEDLNTILEKSKEKPSIIFKHSTRCGISSHALFRLESEWNKLNKEINFYYLDLLNYRNISNEIAQKFNVTHQSPQIIIIQNKKVISHFSHQSISIDKIKKHI